MSGVSRSRGPWLATVLSLIGIGVVGIGLAYSLDASSDLGTTRRDAPTVNSDGVTVDQKITGVPITPGREVIGAIVRIGDDGIEVRSAPGAATVSLGIDHDTQVTTTRGGHLADLAIGDVVMIQVSEDGREALAIYAGQISVAGSLSVG